MAIPNGGVPVALPIAEHLGLPLYLCIAVKIPWRWLPRVGLGAAQERAVFFNCSYVTRLGVSWADLCQGVQIAVGTVLDRVKFFFPQQVSFAGEGFHPLPAMRDKTVMLVDDGVATGYTAYAAIAKLATCCPRRVVVATPVCSRQALATLAVPGVLVELMTLFEDPSPSFLVDDYYDDFSQLSKDEVGRLWERCHPASDTYL